jgi:DNA-binding SARP family transcriptional activator
MTSTAASFWQAHLFGQFECAQGDHPSILPAASNARILLAYLLRHKGRAFPRSVLADLIAPDLAEVQARHALSQALWQIRRCLPGLLESDASQVGIASHTELWVDALEFQALVERSLAGQEQPAALLASLRQAVDLYRGDLLEGFYEEWVLIERERLRELFLQALERLVTAFKAALQYQQALITAQRLVSADPLNEAAHREVMRLYHYLGSPAEALRQYEIIRGILRQEFDLEPEVETSQIAQAIAQRSGREAVPYLPEPQAAQEVSLLGDHTVSTLPLIGRNLERARLIEWLRYTQAAGGKLVLVEGEAGVGKTRLLQEVARDLEWHGAQVLWGKAIPFTDSRPLEPLVAALESGLNPLRVDQLQHLVEPLWLQTLGPILPRVSQNLPGLVSLPMLEDRQAKTRLLEGLIHLLAAWAQINPLVLIIEDVHWADADIMDILTGLASRLDQENVLLVLSYRPEELTGLPEIQAKLDAIQPEAVRGRLALAGLEAAAVHELIQACLGAGETSPAFHDILSRETHGNPLFILEVMRGLYDEGVLRRSEAGAWITPYDSAMGEMDLPLPPAVEQVIVRRLEQLPEVLRGLLQGLAVLGGEFDFKMAACLGLADAPALVSWLQALCKRRLLVESPQAYHFAHDKIRQVVYENLDAVQRTAWHSRLAAALEETYPERVEALALHYSTGEIWHKALEYQQRAATRAQAAQAFTAALGHWNSALQAADHLRLATEARFHPHSAREAVLDILGLREAQTADLEAMARLAQESPLQQSEVCQRKARWLLNLGRFVEAVEMARQALDLVKDQSHASGDSTSQAQAMIVLAETILFRGTQDMDEVMELLRSAGDMCRKSGNFPLEAEVHHRLAQFDRGLSNAVRRDEAQAALTLYTRLGDRAGEASALCSLGWLCYEMGEHGDITLDYYRRSIEIARAIGYRLIEARATSNLGSTLLQGGQIGQALQAFSDATRLFEQIGDTHRAVFTKLQQVRVQCLLIGHDPTVKAQTESLLEYGRQSNNPRLVGYTQLMLGIIAWRERQFTAAEAYLHAAAQSLPSSPQSDLIRLTIDQCLGCLMLDKGQAGAALELLERALERARQGGYVGMEVSLLADRGRSLLALGQGEAALACTTEAMARFKSAEDLPWMTPFAHYQVLHALGKVGEARAALEKAYQLLCEMLASLTPEQQAMSRTSIPEHGDILQAWQAAQPRCIAVRLPSASAPLGRPLHADEWVQVNWTVAAPEDDDIPGKVERRRARLLRLLNEARHQGAAPTSGNLAQALGVSVRTIATDLTALQLTHDELLRTSLRGLTKV